MFKYFVEDDLCEIPFLKEIEQHLKDQRNKRAKSAWGHYHSQPTAKTTKPKSHWG